MGNVLSLRTQCKRKTEHRTNRGTIITSMTSMVGAVQNDTLHELLNKETINRFNSMAACLEQGIMCSELGVGPLIVN